MIEDFNETFDIALALHAVHFPSPHPPLYGNFISWIIALPKPTPPFLYGNFISWIIDGVLRKDHANSNPGGCIQDFALQWRV
jgi:hypothetical protein